MSWNPVLNKSLEIKKEFILTFGAGALYSYDKEKETCLEYWVRMLDNPKYQALIEPLQINEHNGFLLIRYANYWSTDDEFDTERDFFKRYDGFYQECRSVVLDIYKNDLVLTPFKKFRNLNECEEYSLENVQKRIENATTIEIYNKLDGSMQSARYYGGDYIMAGSQALDPEHSWRLQSGYRLLEDNYRLMLRMHPEYTFIFEHITQEDVHVVKYTKEQEVLYIIGIRNVETGEELSYQEVLSFAKKYGIKTTEVFDKTLEEVLAELGDKTSDEAEGIVLNIDGFKVKIKYDDYLMMHHMIDRLSSVNTIIRAIADGTYDDAISRVPESYRERIEIIADAIFDYMKETERKINQFYRLVPKKERAEFMQWVDDFTTAKYRGYVKSKYLNEPYNVLKNSGGGYKSLSEIGIQKENLFPKDIDTEDYCEDIKGPVPHM